MIYILLIVIIIGAYFLVPKIEKDKDKARKTFIIVSFLLIFVVCVLRKYTVGRDLAGYREVYLSIRDGVQGNISTVFRSVFAGEYAFLYFEKGYMDLMYLCGFFGLSFQWFLVVCYLIMLIPIAVFINRFSENILLSVMFFICYMFFDFYMTGLRQAMSMSIVLLGITFYLNSKKKLTIRLLVYYLFVGLAFLFHQGAIIAIFLPLLSVTKKPSIFSIICVFMYGFLYLNSGLLILISQAFSNGNDFSPGHVGYVGTNAIFLGVFTVLTIVLNYFRADRAVGLRERHVYLPIEQESFFINMLLFSMVLSIYFGWNSSARMAMYYSISLVISAPMILKYFNKRSADIICSGLTVCLITYFLYNVFAGKTFDIYPYQFFWE